MQTQGQETLRCSLNQTNAESITSKPHSGFYAAQKGMEQMSPTTQTGHPSALSSSHFMIPGKVLMYCFFFGYISI